MTVDDRTLHLPANRGMVETNDAGLAREVDTRYGVKGEARPGDVVVVEREDRGHDGIHHYTFSMPEMPWKKKKEEQDGNRDQP